MVKLLVANGADVNQRNYRGVTALMTAAHDGTTSVVSYLLEKGADAQARDKEGNTALMYAENPEIIEVLKRKQIETRPQ